VIAAESQQITASQAKTILGIGFESGKDFEVILKEGNFSQISDASAIEKIAREIAAKNADNVAKYRAGNEGVFKFFVGQVMRETRGQANPQLVNEIVKRVLSE